MAVIADRNQSIAISNKVKRNRKWPRSLGISGAYEIPATTSAASFFAATCK
jgi:hypothetical protein